MSEWLEGSSPAAGHGLARAWACTCSSALRSSIVFDPAVQRLGGVLSVAGIACSSQTIDSDNSASESFSSARKHTSLVFVLSYLPRGGCGGKKHWRVSCIACPTPSLPPIPLRWHGPTAST